MTRAIKSGVQWSEISCMCMNRDEWEILGVQFRLIQILKGLCVVEPEVTELILLSWDDVQRNSNKTNNLSLL